MLRVHLNLDEYKGVMSILSTGAFALALNAALFSPSAYAFDTQSDTLGAEEPVEERFSPPSKRLLPGKPGEKIRSFFKFGFSAYKSGKKEEAFDFYTKSAKEEGHVGAQWALANMYAAGDGVPEDDYQAFKIFQKIANQGVDQGSRDTSYVSGALVALGNYIQIGIPETPIRSDPALARDIYWQAAVNYGDPNAQFMLGKMFLDGDVGKVDLGQAARWFNASAKKGHAGGRAMLGKMMFDAGKTAKGLGMMIAALEIAQPADRAWIRSMQEQAFALSNEKDRRIGLSLSSRYTPK